MCDFIEDEELNTADNDPQDHNSFAELSEKYQHNEYSTQAAGANSGSLSFRTQLQLAGERLLRELLAHYNLGIQQYARTLGIRSQEELAQAYADGMLQPISRYIYEYGLLKLNEVVETTLGKLAIRDRATLGTLRSVVGLFVFALNLPYDPSSDPGLYFLESVKLLEKHLLREGLLIHCSEDDDSSDSNWQSQVSVTTILSIHRNLYGQAA